MGEVRDIKSRELLENTPTLETPPRGKLKLVGGAEFSQSSEYVEAKQLALATVDDIKNLATTEHGVVPLSHHDEDTQLDLTHFGYELNEYLSVLNEEDIAEIRKMIEGIFDYQPNPPAA